MPAIQEMVSLLRFNTMAVDVSARYFCEFSEHEQLPQLIEFSRQHSLPFLVLGGGSNIVLRDDFPGLVIKNNLQGITQQEASEQVILKVAAGENWHQLVMYCLQNNLYGIENLALIPGSAGAAPIQNIGAYGVELSNVLESVTGWDCQTACWRQLSSNECELGYRDSIFKHALKGRFIITEISLRMHKTPRVNISYGALASALNDKGLVKPSPQQVAETVIAIRKDKLPDPAQLPNAGSFFKNPVVSKKQANALKLKFPGLVAYPQSDGSEKLAAGWLLEHAGWKGKRLGKVGMHQLQSLVMVNYDNGSGDDIVKLAAAIQADIQALFGLSLMVEPDTVPAW